MRALADAFLVTPTVVKLSPAPELQMIGNLSEEEEVLRALGLPQKENFGPQDLAMVQFYHPVRNGSFRLIEATEGNGDETALAAEFHLPKCCAAYSQRLSPISWNKTAFSESAPKQRRPC